MHSIQIAAEKSGLTPDVIRVWERRYQAISPMRTASNQRSYSADDIYRLVLLRKVTESGKRIGSVANLQNTELEALASELDIANELSSEDQIQESLSHNYLETCLSEILAMNGRTLERYLQQALVEMGLVSFLRDLLHPLLIKVGNLWQNGNIRTCQEHFASAAIRSFLGRFLIDSNTDLQGPRMIVATPPNHYHELGATMAGVIAATRGWQVVYLGAAVPAEELAFAADCKDAKGIVLSISYPAFDPEIPEYLRRLKQLKPGSTEILVGGASHLGYKEELSMIGALCSQDLDAFIEHIDALRES
ncbi:MAG: cobalamin B12-binding domain-containing protein [Pseudomonadales bacterium]|nr:cobalamin B12-binding domain-containing protein [Pseudomonadales bacterium]